jgi:hypothetical protein
LDERTVDGIGVSFEVLRKAAGEVTYGEGLVEFLRHVSGWCSHTCRASDEVRTRAVDLQQGAVAGSSHSSSRLGEIAKRAAELFARARELGRMAGELQKVAHERGAEMLAGHGVDGFVVLSTAVVLRVLETRFIDRQPMWAALVAKSRDWLAGILRKWPIMVQGRSIEEWAADSVPDDVPDGR